MTRPNFRQYLYNLVDSVAERATCDRGKSAAITVIDGRILTTGYVGSPPGLPHCDDVGHLIRKVEHTDGQTREHCIRTTHAEMNAIAQAARFGVSLHGADLYCTMMPCFDCAKLIVSVGIRFVYTKNDYHASHNTTELFKKTNTGFYISNEQVQQY